MTPDFLISHNSHGVFSKKNVKIYLVRLTYVFSWKQFLQANRRRRHWITGTGNGRYFRNKCSQIESFSLNNFWKLKLCIQVILDSQSLLLGEKMKNENAEVHNDPGITQYCGWIPNTSCSWRSVVKPWESQLHLFFPKFYGSFWISTVV